MMVLMATCPLKRNSVYFLWVILSSFSVMYTEKTILTNTYEMLIKEYVIFRY